MPDQNQPVSSSPMSSSEHTTQPGGQKNIVMAVVAYIIFFIPLLTESKKDPFVKFHVKQGLVLFIAAIIVGIINNALFYAWTFMWLGWLLNVGILILFVLGIINAAGGKTEKLPVIGQFADKFNF
ncbi:MAG: hypothetical protein WCX97_00070 [Candidatus Magasanikbacteria bacterium]